MHALHAGSHGTCEALSFHVTYRLGEYLRIVRTRAFAMAPLDQVGGLQRWAYNVVLTIAWTGLFLRKSAHVGTCHFRIDHAGIHRTSKGGHSVHLPWTRVAVSEDAVGYLFEGGTGAMPVPFRVLSPDQRAALEGLLGRYGRQAPHPSRAVAE